MRTLDTNRSPTRIPSGSRPNGTNPCRSFPHPRVSWPRGGPRALHASTDCPRPLPWLRRVTPTDRYITSVGDRNNMDAVATFLGIDLPMLKAG
jgi:hypothetical protein